MNSRQSLLTSISKTLFDFRIGEIERISEDYINKWVLQFEEKDQLVILQEMDHIFKKYYLTREKAKELIKSFLFMEEISGKDPYKNLREINFLDIQTKGTSQRELLLLVDEILNEEFNINIDQCGGSNKYIYLDDCIYTGNRCRYDLVPWLEEQNPDLKIELYTYHYAAHFEGAKYGWGHVLKEANKKGYYTEGYFDILIDNTLQQDKSPDVLWPHYDIEDKRINYYELKLKEEREMNQWRGRTFRNKHFKNETLFTSYQARQIVENAFLRKGIDLIFSANNPIQSLRPLGFEKLPSMGFGSVFVTYRNIANNCPLVLWYGDPERTTGPLSKWQPLFQRKTNSSNIYF